MNNLQIFNSEEFGDIRTVTINNEPWFVGKDVAEALGYSNASKAVSTHVGEEDRILKVLEADSQNGNVVKTQTEQICRTIMVNSLIWLQIRKPAKTFTVRHTKQAS